jgi:N-acetylneuraminic acid mutarotase
MKKLFTLIMILLAGYSQAQWIVETPMTDATAQHMGASHPNGNLYVYGGYTSSSTLINSLQIYNTSTDTWSFGPALGAGGRRGSGFCLGTDNKFYVVSGFSGSFTPTVYRFDPGTNAWNTLANVSVAAFEGSAASHAGKVYFIGGMNSSGFPIANVQIYDITANTWSFGSAIPVPVRSHEIVATPSGHIYLFGGVLTSGAINTTVYRYEISTNSWSSVAAMPASLNSFGACRAADGNIYLVGGKTIIGNHATPVFNTTWIFSPSTNSFSSGPTLPGPIGEQVAVSTPNGIYSLGGSNGGSTNFNWFLTVMAPLVNTAPVGPHCVGATFNVSYSTSGSTYNSGNIFTAQLSDAGGSFASPTAIGSASGTTDGSISVTIPPGTVAGTGYRIRIISSNPVITGSDNGSDITVNSIPEVTCPSTQSVFTSPGQCGTTVPFSATATGVPAPTITFSPVQGTFLGLGNNTIVATATNSCGSDNCSYIINVSENEPPVAQCQNISVTLDGTGTASITAAQINNGSTDNCSISGISVTPSTFSCANIGANTVTLLVTDASGNTSSCTATVTVQDNIAPVAVCQNITVSLNGSGTASITALQIDNGSSDNCSIASMSVSPNSFSCANIGANVVTLLVTDQSGNTSTCTAIVTILDNTAPSALCQNITVSLNGSGTASITAAQIDNGSSDNCSITSMSVSPSTFSCANIGANVVTLLVTDQSGNTSTCTATVTVQDNSAPVALCQNITVSLNGSGSATISASQIDNGSSDNCSITSMSVSPSTFSCANIGANVVTLLVTDQSGNTSTCTATVTVQDNSAPVALCQNITVSLNGSGTASITASQINNGSTDNCTITSMSVTPNTFSCANIGANVVTLLVTDQSGNTAACTATVTVQDNIAPVAQCQNVTVSLNSSGTGSITAAQIDNGSSDNCTITSISVSPNTFSCANIGANVVTLLVTDQSGNTASCTATVTVQDNIAPIALCQNITVSLNGSGSASITASQINNGSTDNCTITSMSVTPNTFSCANIGANVVTLLVTDQSGNTATCTATVTVQDNSTPVVLCQNITVSLNSSGTASITTSQIDNGSSDNCSIISMNVSPSTFSCVNIGANVVTLLVTDQSGNTATCTATVTVQDNSAPVALCQNITVSLNSSGTASVTTAQIDNGSSDNCTITSMSVTPNTFSCSNIGANVVTLLVTDQSSNTATCTATVTVQDNIAPVAQCQNITVSLNSGGTASITAAQIDNGSSDNCTITSISVSPSTFNCTNIGANVVTLLVTDQSGNTAMCTATVTVQDNIAPVAQCQNITVSLGGSGSVTVTPAQIDNGSSDNCSISGMMVTPNTFTCANIGANTVTLLVTDISGNTTTCTATVTVLENTPPVAVCQNITVSLNSSGTAGITASQIDNGSSDNCGIASMSVSPGTFTCSNIGANTVTLLVTDLSGNTSTCTATVTVQDNIAPVAQCQNITVSLNSSGTASITAAQVNNGSTDNCTIANMNVSPSTFTCSNIGANTVTLLVTDQSGNTSTCTAIVTVQDNIAPVAQCQNITVSLNSSGSASITAAQINNGSTDNCTIANMSVTPSLFGCANLGANTVVLQVTDQSGNTSTCTAVVTVEDQIAPVAQCQNITVQMGPSGVVTISPSQVNNGSADACGISSMSVSPNTFTCSNIGSNTVVLTVSDASGNSGTCSATVVVEDVNPPVASCQNITVYLNNAGAASITAAMIDNGSSDNCGVASMTVSPASFSCSNLGTNTVTLSVVDFYGNISTCSATVTVIDSVKPVISCPSTISVNNSSGVCGAPINYNVVTSDNCGPVSLNLLAGLPSGSIFPIGVTVNTYEATDIAGNTSVCSFEVIIVDIESPVITSVPANFSACNPVNWVPPTITDNCPGVQIVSNYAPGDIFPTGTTTVTYVATDAYGNQSSASFNVTLLLPSIAASGINSNREYNNICLGENITLTLYGGFLGVSSQWKWYTGSCGGTLVGTGTSITVSPTSTRTYYVRAEGQCNVTSCVQIDVIVSTAPPVGSVTYSYLPNQGAPGVTDSIKVLPVTGATYYRWATNNGQINGVLFNGNISPVQTAIPKVDITFVLPQQNYQLRVLAGNACGRTPQANDHVRGTVPPPTGISGPTTVCPGQTASYTVTAIPPVSGNNNVTYNWQLIPSGAGTISGTGLTRSITFNSGYSSAQLCVNGISTFGLPGAPYCIVININEPAVPGPITGDPEPCQNGTETYSILPVSNAVSYNWTTNISGAVITQNGTSATISFPNNAFAGNICVNAVNACGLSTPNCLALVAGTPGIPGPVTGPVQGICGASNVNYSLSTSNALSYNWIVPVGVSISGASNMNAVNLNFGAGFTNGTITVQANYKCGSSFSSIFVDGSPSQPIVTPATICAGTNTVYFASSTGANSYNWVITGDDFTSCTNPPSCSQQYIEWSISGGSFSVTASNSCGTSTPFNLSTNCKISGTDEFVTNVYPNPTAGSVTVEFIGLTSGDCQISVTDLSGRVILTDEMKVDAGLNRHQIDLSFANRGLYMLYLKDQNGRISVTKVAVE